MSSEPRKGANQSQSFAGTAKETSWPRQLGMKGQSENSLVHKQTGTWNKDWKNKHHDGSMGFQVLPMVKQEYIDEKCRLQKHNTALE